MTRRRPKWRRANRRSGDCCIGQASACISQIALRQLAGIVANYMQFPRSNQLLPGFFDAMDGTLVVSPHLDDAVFSCGDWLARHPGTLVATVFAGAPRRVTGLTSWDAACGFADAHEAVAARRAEDSAALATLAAGAIWLDFLDSQYLDSPSPVALRDALHGLIERTSPDTVLFPAGLFHSDHVLVHAAMLALCRAHPRRRWMMYEDALYRRGAGCLQQRLSALLADGFCATPVAAPAAPAAPKCAALACYRSQLRALRQPADLVAPEGYWRVEGPS